MNKKLAIMATVAAMSVAAFGTVANAEESKGVIGVAMPTQDLQRWNQDGENMKAQLEEKGYTVDLQTVSGTMPANNVEITVKYSNNSYWLRVNPNGGVWETFTSTQAYGMDNAWSSFAGFVDAVVGVYSFYPKCTNEELCKLFSTLKFEVLDE